MGRILSIRSLPPDDPIYNEGWTFGSGSLLTRVLANKPPAAGETPDEPEPPDEPDAPDPMEPPDQPEIPEPPEAPVIPETLTPPKRRKA